MPIVLKCPCGAKLNAPDTAAGKRVKCPKCGDVLTVPAPVPDEDFEVLDDDEPTPVKRRVRRDEDDDAEEDRPRPKKKKKGKKAAPKSTLPLILGVGGGVLVLAVVGVLVAFVMMNKGTVAKRTGSGGGAGGGAVANQPNGPPAGWQEFTQPEFTAYFPAGIAPQDLSAQAQVGLRQQPGTTVKMFMQQEQGKESGCMVMVYTHPPSVMANITANKTQAFDELAKRLATIEPGTRIQSQTPITTAGQDGTQYEMKSQKDVSFLRVFLAKQRLYVIVAGGPNATENDTLVRGFFENFQPK